MRLGRELRVRRGEAPTCASCAGGWMLRSRGLEVHFAQFVSKRRFDRPMHGGRLWVVVSCTGFFWLRVRDEETHLGMEQAYQS